MKLSQRLYVILSRIPGLILLILWLFHLSDLIEHRVSAEEFEHPWTIFSIVVSVFLFFFHTFVYIVLTFHLYDSKRFGFRWLFYCLPKQEASYHEYELTLVSLDLVWSICWLLQCASQAFIPKAHRLYPPEAIRAMMGLYVVQILLTLPILISLIRKQKPQPKPKPKPKPKATHQQYKYHRSSVKLKQTCGDECSPDEIRSLLTGGDSTACRDGGGGSRHDGRR